MIAKRGRGRPRKIHVEPLPKRSGPLYLRSRGAKIEAIDTGEGTEAAERDPHLAWIFDDSPLPDPHGRGAAAIKFLTSLKHPKSTAPNNRFTLVPWQERIVRRIYGDTDQNGRRRISTVFILLPRGNRKTSLGAALALLNTVGPEKRVGGQSIVAAVDREQARIAYEEAVNIIRMQNPLVAATRVVDSESIFTDKASGASFTAVAAQPQARHGSTPVFVLADELHAWTCREIWSVLRTGAAKTPESLVVVITTAGRGQQNLAHDMLTYARKVARGEIVNPGFLPILFEPASGTDWRDERMWHAVNPGLAYGFPDLTNLRQLASEAAELPYEREAFKQLNCNFWQDGSAAPFVEMQVYDEGADAIDIEALKGRECWIGVDLSSVRDLTAIVAIFREGSDYKALAWFFVPRGGIQRKAEVDGVPYPLWNEQGFITATPGDAIDHRVVEAKLRELCDLYSVQEIAFDPYMAQPMQSNLLEDGYPVVSFRQGWGTMGPAIKTLEEVIINRHFHHGGNPVLRWNFSNVHIEVDKAENKSFHKGKATGRIDGAVAAAMALHRASLGVTSGSIYDTADRAEGFLVL
jgi:phage terminase large subunit-like protein